MAKEKTGWEKRREGSFERGSRWYRNFNAVVGGVALLGAGVVGSPAAAGALTAYAGFNFVQAGLGEAGRRYGKKKRIKKEKNEKK
jgi:hypothetical protein